MAAIRFFMDEDIYGAIAVALRIDQNQPHL
jgi:hypothetical protein